MHAVKHKIRFNLSLERKAEAQPSWRVRLLGGDTCVGRLILTTSYFDPSPLDWAAEQGALGRRSRRTSQEPSDETTGTFFFADLDSSAARSLTKKGTG